MTPFPYSIEIGDHVAKAKALMKEHDIRHLPVTKDGELTGIVSDRDLQWVIAMVASNRLSSEEDITVGEIYQKDVYKADLEERCDFVLENMAERHIGSTLITKHGKLVGIFTSTDACRAFADHLRVEFSISENPILA